MSDSLQEQEMSFYGSETSICNRESLSSVDFEGNVAQNATRQADISSNSIQEENEESDSQFPIIVRL
jgi:hypothetical protein